MSSTDQFDQEILKFGEQILTASNQAGMQLFDKGYWSGRMMEWSMQYPAFKTELFRFVDVLPSLTTPEQVAEHIRQYFLREELDFPGVIRAGLGFAASTGFTAKIAASTIKKNVSSMASTFIVGEDSATAKKALEKLWTKGFCFTVDLLGEAVVSENEAADYEARYLELAEGLAKEVQVWKPQALLESNPLGAVPRANVSVKCSALYSQTDSLSFRASVDGVKNRLRNILRVAVKNNVFVNLDMEQTDYKDLLLTVAEEIFSEPEFVAYPHFGIVLQAYLKAAHEDVDRVVAFAKTRKAPLTVRLVKGAYWDFEVIRAREKGWEIPVYTNKAETDAQYERCAGRLLEAYPTILSAFGSHNIRSLSYVVEKAKSLGMAKSAFEIQMLFGMAEPFKAAFRDQGFRVREYAPVGEMLPGMAYLVRRLLENTSNEGWLRAKFVDGADMKVLLSNPAAKIPLKAASFQDNSEDFHNESMLDFSVAANRDWFAPTIAKIRKDFPVGVTPVVAGKAITANLNTLEVKNPSLLTETVARLSLGTRAEADIALDACERAKLTWGRKTAEDRSKVIQKAAQLLRDRRRDFTALMVLEVGKTLKESDADVCEAIDFCDYYASEMLKLGHDRLMGKFLGEQNFYGYRPRGTTVAIAPWNFPLAILCGMTVGPLVAGNPVIMKPAEQSSVIGKKLFDLLIEAGVPGEALHFLPGLGEDVGAYLVAHPKVHIINFTGSRAVGLKIIQEAAIVRPGQRHIKKVLAEMGGKNAIIIDDDADLDEAVMGSIQSAFGFQGQKCSAASRLLVHESCYDRFKARLAESITSLKMGRSEDVSAKIGPVIDLEAATRLRNLIEKHHSKILGQLEVPSELRGTGHFVPPTIFEESDLKSDLLTDEHFGPILAIHKVASLDVAIRIMNDVDYALTGGIYSRSPENLERARRDIEVGNLYVNRGITGALVHRQPFGGYKLSGVGAKAGGPDYLLQFLEPVAVTENTMRRGFAPELNS